jgi:hypothetical protein
MSQKEADYKDIRIDPNGEEHLLESNDKYYGLKFLQDQVGGLIEMIHCPFSRNHMGVANEEGLLLGLDYNAKASEMFDGALVGPVLIISKSRINYGEDDE